MTAPSFPAALMVLLVFLLGGACSLTLAWTFFKASVRSDPVKFYRLICDSHDTSRSAIMVLGNELLQADVERKMRAQGDWPPRPPDSPGA